MVDLKDVLWVVSMVGVLVDPKVDMKVAQKELQLVVHLDPCSVAWMAQKWVD